METISLFKNRSDYKTLGPGDIIFRQGDQADNMYVVQEGEVEILVNDRVIETAREGYLFGEMALIDKKE